MRDECTHCGTPKSDDYVCCAWAENDALRARLAPRGPYSRNQR